MEQEPKTFYSPARGLCIAWNNGVMAIGEDGKSRRVGERHIHFIDSGDKFGSFTTRDPEEIAYLEKRAKTHRDIYTQDEYIQALIPVEQRLAQSEEMSRKLEEQNKLLADIRQRELELKQELEELRANTSATDSKQTDRRGKR